MLTTTLNHIKDQLPCRDGWEKLLKGLGKTKADDEPLTYARILEINGIDDALWACRAEPQHGRLWRLYAVWAARQVQHLMKDARSIAALDVAERHANGLATDYELAAAWDAAWAARDAAADAAGYAARDAAWDAAGDAWATSWAAADAAGDAARGATRAAASGATRAAARGAARVAARDAQAKRFLALVTIGKWED